MKELNKREWCVAVVCFALIAMAGCSKKSSQGDAVVQGTVTVDGVLAERGTVTFIPVQDGPVGMGTIDEKGTFSLRVGQGNFNDPNQSMIPSGEYVVTVVVNEPAAAPAPVEGDEVVGPPAPGPRLTAAKYASKEATDLKYTVKSGRNVFPLELESSANDPLPEATEDDKAAVEYVEAESAETQPESDSEPGEESVKPQDAATSESEASGTEPAVPSTEEVSQ